jgi:hypothetical protein
VKDRAHPAESHPNPASRAFADFRADRPEQGLDVAPPQIGRRRLSENARQRLFMASMHGPKDIIL